MLDSQRIIELKNFLGISFNKLAEEIGLNTSQTLYDIKNGKHRISKDVAEKISTKYLNISTSWLLTGEGKMLKEYSDTPPSQNTPTVAELMAIIKSQQETILELTRRLPKP